jgi:hypothetical protein
VSDGDIDPDDAVDDDPNEGRADDEGAYVCGSCGESIVIPLDPSAGRRQRYVEDCPVCCAPNEISVEFDEDGEADVTSRLESQ